MSTRGRWLLVVAALSLVAAMTACGGDDDDSTAGGSGNGSSSGDGGNTEVDPGAENVRAVPDEYDTIQDAVDAAQPGDLVLVSPGVYNEAVTVTTDDIVIRGLDRNEVILDGQDEMDNGIRVLEADGVAIENMTARHYTTNGFFWTSAKGYRGSYLTAANNGDYGIYAFDSVTGVFEHSYGSGSPDAGFYIGQCNPCDAVIDDAVSENNGLGYSGTNAGGNLLIVNSTFRNNRAGIVPNSGTYEKYSPERATTIVGNLVYSNNNYSTGAIDAARTAEGNGILTAGGNDNLVERNRVFDHDLVGIGVIPIDDEHIEGGAFWPTGNTVRDNVIEDSRLTDLVLVDQSADSKNCFAGNTMTTTAPRNLEQLMPCDGVGQGDRNDGAFDLLGVFLGEKHANGDYKTMPAPEARDNMPDAAKAPWKKAGSPPAIDLASITVPPRP